MFQSEKALLEAFIEATQALDPDIILGFEVQKGSLGYLADRAATMDLPLLKLVSRTPEVCCLSFLKPLSMLMCHATNVMQCFSFCSMQSPSLLHDVCSCTRSFLLLSYSTHLCGTIDCLSHNATLCLHHSCQTLGLRNAFYTARYYCADPHDLWSSHIEIKNYFGNVPAPLRGHALSKLKHYDAA